MANWNRKSRVSQNRNRKQSQKRSNRRGGAPPVAPPPPARSEILKGKKMTGTEATGHSVCPPLPEQDCGGPKGNPACRWNKPSVDGKRRGYCSRKPDYIGMTQDKYASATADIDERRRLALKAMYESDDEPEASQSSDNSPMASAQYSAPVRVSASAASSASPLSKASVSKKSPTPAQLRRASAKASGQVYVPVKSANVPMGCVQRNYNIHTKTGISYSSSRCVDSKDPNENDDVNCMVNPQTNKCKKVARA